jgi:hypothetical protein
MMPMDFVEVFKSKFVTDVVRLNAPEYNASDFTKAGTFVTDVVRLNAPKCNDSKLV